MTKEDDFSQKLREQFRWVPGEPGPDTVEEQAKKRGIHSVDELIDFMENAPENRKTGYQKWAWRRNHGGAFVD